MPSPVIARTGRQKQRYENNFRLVSGCIPYKLAKENGQRTHHDMESTIEVLMISTPNRDDLVFPKGGWEDDETVEQAACREALEEAGVIGTIKAPLGDWEFRSKSRQEMCSLEGGCRGWMFAMEVTKELEAWPEQGNHNRIWLSIKDAYRLCRYDWMRMALQEFVRIMAANWRQELMEAVAESPSKAVSDTAIDCPITLPYCDAQPLSTQNLGHTKPCPYTTGDEITVKKALCRTVKRMKELLPPCNPLGYLLKVLIIKYKLSETVKHQNIYIPDGLCIPLPQRVSRKHTVKIVS